MTRLDAVAENGELDSRAMKLEDRAGSVTVSMAGCLIYRRQFPVTSAYTFTDHRSQGQTIPAAAVDLVLPPRGGTLKLFSLYATSMCHFLGG